MSPVVVIIGAGPAGLICARELVTAGVSAVMIERRLACDARVGEIVSPIFLRSLRGLGLESLDALGRGVDHFYSAWGADDLDARDYRFWQAGSGLALSRPKLDQCLRIEALKAGVTLLTGLRPSACVSRYGRWDIQLRQGDGSLRLDADFVVEATGVTSRSSAYADVRRHYSDRLICFSTILSPSDILSRAALVEACADGWWFAAPTADGRQIISFFTDADLSLETPPAARMRKALEDTKHLREIVFLDEGLEIRAVDARTSTRSVFWRGNWLVIGDAAWNLDPLSGTGVERAAKDGIAAAAAIVAAFNGDHSALRQHATLRAEAFQQGLAMQRRIYCAENRWLDQPFWHRRQHLLNRQRSIS